MIRAVVSDFGGVLTSPLNLSFVEYQRSTGITVEAFGMAMVRAAEAAGGLNPLFELEKGAITEAEFLRRLEEQLDPGTRLEGFGEAFFAHLHPNEPMIAFMGALRARGLRMALCTNNVREWEPLWRAKLPEIDAIFDTVVDSAFVGVRKPDPAIYELVLERLGDGLAPEQLLLVDDLDVNCETARELGMTAVHFDTAEQAIRELESALEPG